MNPQIERSSVVRRECMTVIANQADLTLGWVSIPVVPHRGKQLT